MPRKFKKHENKEKCGKITSQNHSFFCLKSCATKEEATLKVIFFAISVITAKKSIQLSKYFFLITHR